MNEEHDRTRFWTIPNILSLLRIALVPVFVILFFSQTPYARAKAIAVFLLAGLTDVLDGWIARRFHQISLAGRILDPAADKLMVVSALICLMADHIVSVWLVVLYFLKELTQAILGFRLMHRIQDMPASNLLGKLGTLSFYFTIVTLTLFAPPLFLKRILLTLSYCLILAAFLSYYIRAMRLIHPNDN